VTPVPDDLGEAFWESHYRDHPSAHHYRPNAHLVSEAADLVAGRALDAGCGEGADATWLASRGWQVTAVDLSRTALQRARERAEGMADVGDRIEWVQADLTSWTPTGDYFDMVSAQYVHVPEAVRESLFERLAAAVAPGGTLLVTGHHPSDLDTTMERGEQTALYVTAEQIAATLHPDRWVIEVAESRPREETDREHREVTVSDTVLRARRLP
jgi:SAM-dependent methyltransferase